MSVAGCPDVDLDRVFREEHGRVVATPVRQFGDIDVAEEAAQDAFVIALQRWPESGVPPNPGGWLTSTARNRAIDRIRRESTRDARHAQAAILTNQLYDRLYAATPTLVVALNRAIAVAEVDGPAAGLAIVDELTWPATTRSTPPGGIGRTS